MRVRYGIYVVVDFRDNLLKKYKCHIIKILNTVFLLKRNLLVNTCNVGAQICYKRVQQNTPLHLT